MTTKKKKYNNTKKLLQLYKKRNFTHKSFSYFKDNISSYLTPKELSSLKEKNDIMNYTHIKNKNLKNKSLIKSLLKYNQHYYHHKHDIKKLAKEIQEYYHPKPYIFSEDYDLTISGKKNKLTTNPIFLILSMVNIFVTIKTKTKINEKHYIQYNY